MSWMLSDKTAFEELTKLHDQQCNCCVHCPLDTVQSQSDRVILREHKVESHNIKTMTKTFFKSV